MKAPQAATILIVDGQTLFRAGLRATLAADPSLAVTDEADDGETALALVMAAAPDIVLIDVDLGPPGGFEIAVQIRRAASTAAIIVLSDADTEDELFQAIKVGAAAYVSKAIEPAELLATVQQVARGDYPINDLALSRRSIATKVLDEFQALSVYGPRARSIFAPLSPREIEVLGMVTNGLTNKEIAHALNLSEQTVKNHMTSILRKLSVNDRTQAVVYAIRQGWIEIGPAV